MALQVMIVDCGVKCLRFRVKGLLDALWARAVTASARTGQVELGSGVTGLFDPFQIRTGPFDPCHVASIAICCQIDSRHQ